MRRNAGPGHHAGTVSSTTSNTNRGRTRAASQERSSQLKNDRLRSPLRTVTNGAIIRSSSTSRPSVTSSSSTTRRTIVHDEKSSNSSYVPTRPSPARPRTPVLSSHAAARRARLLGTTITAPSTAAPASSSSSSSSIVSSTSSSSSSIRPRTASSNTAAPSANSSSSTPSSSVANDARRALQRIMDRNPTDTRIRGAPVRATRNFSLPMDHADSDNDDDITNAYDSYINTGTPSMSSIGNGDNSDDDDALHANRFLYRSSSSSAATSSVSRSTAATGTNSQRSPTTTSSSSSSPFYRVTTNSFARASAAPSISSSTSSSSANNTVPYRIPRPLSAHSSDDSDDTLPSSFPTGSSNADTRTRRRLPTSSSSTEYVSRTGSPRSRYYFSESTIAPTHLTRPPSSSSSSTSSSLRTLEPSSTRSSAVRSTASSSSSDRKSSETKSSVPSIATILSGSTGGRGGEYEAPAELPISPGALRTRIVGLHSRVGELQQRLVGEISAMQQRWLEPVPAARSIGSGSRVDSDDDDEQEFKITRRLALNTNNNTPSSSFAATGRESKRPIGGGNTRSSPAAAASSTGNAGARATAAEWSRRTRPVGTGHVTDAQLIEAERKRNDPRLLHESWRVRQEMRLIRLLTLRHELSVLFSMFENVRNYQSLLNQQMGIAADMDPAAIQAMFDSLESSGAYDPKMSAEHLDGVKSLPTFTLTSALDDRCCICLDGMIIGSEVTPLPCQHNFHNACITTWLQKSNQCPLCKQSAIPVAIPLSSSPSASLSYASSLSSSSNTSSSGNSRTMAMPSSIHVGSLSVRL